MLRREERRGSNVGGRSGSYLGPKTAETSADFANTWKSFTFHVELGFNSKPEEPILNGIWSPLQ